MNRARTKDEPTATGAARIQLLPMLLDQHADLPSAVDTAFTAAADGIANTGWPNTRLVGAVAGEIADTESELPARSPPR